MELQSIKESRIWPPFLPPPTYKMEMDLLAVLSLSTTAEIYEVAWKLNLFLQFNIIPEHPNTGLQILRQHVSICMRIL